MKDLDAVLKDAANRRNHLENAVLLADDLLSARNSSIRQVQLGLSLADLSAASFQSAERTGALGHMDYAEVQKYSRLYAIQDLFSDQQRRSLERTAAALAMLRGDPHKGPAGGSGVVSLGRARDAW
jgi:hypothetical protein